MKKYIVYATLIGCFGMLLMFLQLSVLKTYVIHPLVLPVILIFVISLSAVVITLKLSADSAAQVFMLRVLQTTWLSTTITNLPILLNAGYYLLLQQQNPGVFYRDQAEVAFSIFLFMTGISFVFGIVLSFVACYFVNKRYSPALPGMLD